MELGMGASFQSDYKWFFDAACGIAPH
jgi:hypothetical protein